MLDPGVSGPGRHDQRSRPLLRAMLGEVLRRARRQQGRTLSDVARAARVSMAYLSEVERGRKEVSSEVLAAICEALRIELPELLTEVSRVLAERRARVVRLNAVRDVAWQRAVSDRPGSQAAIGPQPPAIGQEPPAGEPGPPARGPGDARCLLAA